MSVQLLSISCDERQTVTFGGYTINNIENLPTSEYAFVLSPKQHVTYRILSETNMRCELI